MDFETLSKLNAEYAKESQLFWDEFIDLWKKWMKKSPRLAVVNALHFPLNLIMNMIDNGLPQAVPEVPDMMERFLTPMILLKDVWGKIPGKVFIEKYKALYESQWEKLGITPEMKKNFKEWYEKDEARRKSNNAK